MKTFAVDLKQIAVIVVTEGKTERLSFNTKKQADKKMLELIKNGYKFDREWWGRRQHELAILHVQAHDLCNTLCDKLYNWHPEPERKARLERVLSRARARLARREHLS